MKLIPWRNKGENRSLAQNETRAVERGRDDFSELVRRLWENPWRASLHDLWPLSGAWGPRMDMTESDEQVALRFELPGVRPEDVDITVAAGMLTIRGEKRDQHEERRGNAVYSERSFGSFGRTVRLPSTADPDKVDAVYRDGVLTVTVGKRPEAKGRRVKVRDA